MKSWARAGCEVIFIYTKNSARLRFDFIYTKNSARRGQDFLSTPRNWFRNMMKNECYILKNFPRCARLGQDVYLQKADRGVSNIDFLQNQCYILNLFVEIGVYLHELSALRMCSETARKINSRFYKNGSRCARLGQDVTYTKRGFVAGSSIAQVDVGTKWQPAHLTARNSVHDKMMEE